MSLNSPSTVFNNLCEILVELDSSLDSHKKPHTLKASNLILASISSDKDYTILSNLQEMEVELTKMLKTHNVLPNDLETNIQDEATTIFVEHDFTSECISSCPMNCTETKKCLMCIDTQTYLHTIYKLSRKTTRLRRKGHSIGHITFGIPSEYRKTSQYKFHRNKNNKNVNITRTRSKLNKEK
tara:strand:- start:60 stop:608 length:549 start_codon:yes stop_codon:yes gene_type:complete